MVMNPKKHSFPPIGQKCLGLASCVSEAAKFRPLFRGPVSNGSRDKTAGEMIDRNDEPGATDPLREAEERGIAEGSRAAMVDANTECAAELIELLEKLIAAAGSYQDRKKELLEHSGQWILSLAGAICQKVINHKPGRKDKALEEAMRQWMAAGLNEYLPLEAADYDAHQVLMSAGEMLLPCEKSTAQRLKACLDKLRSLPDAFDMPVSSPHTGSIKKLVNDMLSKSGPS